MISTRPSLLFHAFPKLIAQVVVLPSKSASRSIAWLPTTSSYTSAAWALSRGMISFFHPRPPLQLCSDASEPHLTRHHPRRGQVLCPRFFCPCRRPHPCP